MQRITLTIKMKLLLMFIAFFCLPFFILGFLLFNRSSQMMQESAIRNNEQLMRQINYNFDSYFSEIKQATLPLLADPIVQQFVKIEPSDQYQYVMVSDSIKKGLFPIILYNHTDMYGLTLISSKGTYYSSIMFSDRLSHYLSLDIDSAENYRILGISTVNDTPLISIYRKIYDDLTYRTAGFMIIDLKLNRILDIVGRIGLGKTGIVSISDLSGHYVYHVDPSKWSEAIPLLYQSEIRAKGEGYFVNKSGKDSKLVMFHNSTATGLTVITEVPLNELMSDLIRMRNLTLELVLPLILLAFLMIGGFSFSITRPLSRLLMLMKKVEMGNLSIRAPLRDDEIGSLSRGFNHMLDDIQGLIEMNHLSHLKEKEMAVRQRESKLQALQARINPHFLYNTLSVIHAHAVVANVTPVSQMAVWLSDMFRYSIDSPEQAVTLAKEIEHVHNYFNIQGERFQELKVDLLFDYEQLDLVKTLRLTIQPLVENAFIHGYEKCGVKPDYVSIQCIFEESYCSLLITDKGIGMSPEQRERFNNAFEQKTERDMLLQGDTTLRQVGLWNVHSRLRLVFGEPYGLYIAGSGMEGTIVELKLPYVD